MHFVLLACRCPSEVKTCCQIKDVTLNICVYSNIFLLLLCIMQWDDKRKNMFIVARDEIGWNFICQFTD